MGRKGTELTEFEFEMLRRYFLDRSHDYIDIQYQVKVGKHTTYEFVKDRKLRKMIEDGYKLKIDCVAVKMGGMVDLIEIKNVANTGAIGQLLAYKVLYEDEHKRDCKMILLCRAINENIRKACEFYKIVVIMTRDEV